MPLTPDNATRDLETDAAANLPATPPTTESPSSRPPPQDPLLPLTASPHLGAMVSAAQWLRRLLRDTFKCCVRGVGGKQENA